MALIDTDLFGHTRDRVAEAIQRIRAFCPDEGYWLAFSGGEGFDCHKIVMRFGRGAIRCAL